MLVFLPMLIGSVCSSRVADICNSLEILCLTGSIEKK